MGYSKKLPMCPMKKLFMFFQFLLVQNCYANEYFCEFTKKVDSISFVESSEIENSLSEENQEVLKLISEPLLLKINKFGVEQTVRVNNISSKISYEIVKNNKNEMIADYVIVGAGAQILGPITVHRCARVGGNSVVTKDVPEAATVVGVPARQMSKTKTKADADTSFMAYGVQSGIDFDPRERTIRALVDEVQSQRARLSALEDRLASAAVPAVPKKAARKTKPKPVS